MSSITAHTRTRSEYRDFLAAITASPLDDSVRLVFADWLDEQGDIDRAAYIRVEIERATLPEYDDRALWLRYEADALLQRHWREWVADLPEWLRRDADFVRGLPGEVRVDAANFLAHAGDDWTCVPVYRLSLDMQEQSLHEVLACPKLRQIRYLWLHPWRPLTVDVARLADCPHLHDLRVLDLRESGIGDAGIRELARSGSLHSLTELSLDVSQFGLLAAEALGQARFLPRLESLEIGDMRYEGQLGGDAIAAVLSGVSERLRRLSLGQASDSLNHGVVRSVASCPRLRCLRSLSLGGVRLTEGDVVTLAASSVLTELEELHLGTENPTEVGLAALRAFVNSPLASRLHTFRPGSWLLNDEGLQLLAASSALSELRSLDFGGEFTDAGMSALVNSPHLNRVASLRIGGGFPRDWPAVLVTSEWLGRLRKLSLIGHQSRPERGLTADGMRVLASGDLTKLLELEIGANRLGDDGIAALASANCQNLRVLDLYRCQIGPAGIAALARTDVLPRLVQVKMSCNPIGVAGVQALIKWSALAQLVEINLSNCDLGDEGVALLARSGCQPADLSLASNDIGTAGVRALTESDIVSRIVQMELSNNPIGEVGVEALLSCASLRESRNVRFDSYRPNEPRREFPPPFQG